MSDSGMRTFLLSGEHEISQSSCQYNADPSDGNSMIGNTGFNWRPATNLWVGPSNWLIPTTWHRSRRYAESHRGDRPDIHKKRKLQSGRLIEPFKKRVKNGRATF